MIVVTGAAGFIGCNIIQGLNREGMTNIIAVDNLTNGRQYVNLAVTDYVDYLDSEDFLRRIVEDSSFYKPITAIIHQGACSVTTEWNGRYMMNNNYEYTKQLFHYCLRHNIQFIYASSGAVYGDKKQFLESDRLQRPLNVYGYSKWQFDCYQSRYLSSLKSSVTSQVVGLRYFNVYGPYENHKASMASVAFHFMNQLHSDNEVRLFAGSHGYEDGGHLRDFVFVDDIVAVNVWFLKNPKISGIYNVGTGQARSFNEVAKTLIGLHGSGSIRYIPFPEQLKTAYQAYTQADMSALRAAGYTQPFTALETGLSHYYAWYRQERPKFL